MNQFKLLGCILLTILLAVTPIAYSGISVFPALVGATTVTYDSNPIRSGNYLVINHTDTSGGVINGETPISLNSDDVNEKYIAATAYNSNGEILKDVKYTWLLNDDFSTDNSINGSSYIGFSLPNLIETNTSQIKLYEDGNGSYGISMLTVRALDPFSNQIVAQASRLVLTINNRFGPEPHILDPKFESLAAENAKPLLEADELVADGYSPVQPSGVAPQTSRTKLRRAFVGESYSSSVQFYHYQPGEDIVIGEVKGLPDGIDLNTDSCSYTNYSAAPILSCKIEGMTLQIGAFTPTFTVSNSNGTAEHTMSFQVSNKNIRSGNDTLLADQINADGASYGLEFTPKRGSFKVYQHRWLYKEIKVTAEGYVPDLMLRVENMPAGTELSECRHFYRAGRDTTEVKCAISGYPTGSNNVTMQLVASDGATDIGMHQIVARHIPYQHPAWYQSLETFRHYYRRFYIATNYAAADVVVPITL